jgi:hypothetical protein
MPPCPATTGFDFQKKARPANSQTDCSSPRRKTSFGSALPRGEAYARSSRWFSNHIDVVACYILPGNLCPEVLTLRESATRHNNGIDHFRVGSPETFLSPEVSWKDDGS